MSLGYEGDMLSGPVLGIRSFKLFIRVILFANHKANGAVTNIGLSS